MEEDSDLFDGRQNGAGVEIDVDYLIEGITAEDMAVRGWEGRGSREHVEGLEEDNMVTLASGTGAGSKVSWLFGFGICCLNKMEFFFSQVRRKHTMVIYSISTLATVTA